MEEQSLSKTLEKRLLSTWFNFNSNSLIPQCLENKIKQLNEKITEADTTKQKVDEIITEYIQQLKELKRELSEKKFTAKEITNILDERKKYFAKISVALTNKQTLTPLFIKQVEDFIMKLETLISIIKKLVKEGMKAIFLRFSYLPIIIEKVNNISEYNSILKNENVFSLLDISKTYQNCKELIKKIDATRHASELWRKKIKANTIELSKKLLDQIGSLWIQKNHRLGVSLISRNHPKAILNYTTQESLTLAIPHFSSFCLTSDFNQMYCIRKHWLNNMSLIPFKLVPICCLSINLIFHLMLDFKDNILFLPEFQPLNAYKLCKKTHKLFEMPSPPFGIADAIVLNERFLYGFTSRKGVILDLLEEEAGWIIVEMPIYLGRFSNWVQSAPDTLIKYSHTSFFLFNIKQKSQLRKASNIVLPLGNPAFTKLEKNGILKIQSCFQPYHIYYSYIKTPTKFETMHFRCLSQQF